MHIYISTQFLLGIASASVMSHARTVLKGPFDCVTQSTWELCQNEWGAAFGVGNQSSTLINAGADAISWSTAWNWTGGPGQVKSCECTSKEDFL